MKPLVAAGVLNSKEAMLYHNEEDVLHDTIELFVKNKLHYATKGEDHQVSHA